MDDQSIVTLYWNRDESAIQITKEHYGNYLFKIAYNVLSDYHDSEECVNDTYLKAWNSIPPHRPKILSTYLGKITRELSIDVYRKRNRIKRKASEYAVSLSELGDCVSRDETLEDALMAKQLGDAISQYLRTLTPEARNLFIGRYYFMDSLREAAHYCGMSESKAKSILYRTRIGLRNHLRKEGFNL